MFSSLSNARSEEESLTIKRQPYDLPSATYYSTRTRLENPPAGVCRKTHLPQIVPASHYYNIFLSGFGKRYQRVPIPFRLLTTKIHTIKDGFTVSSALGCLL